MMMRGLFYPKKKQDTAPGLTLQLHSDLGPLANVATDTVNAGVALDSISLREVVINISNAATDTVNADVALDSISLREVVINISNGATDTVNADVALDSISLVPSTVFVGDGTLSDTIDVGVALTLIELSTI